MGHTTMDEITPARLHVIIAKESPFAVVFRRGPSKRVCTFLWDREKDEFTIGQWLKGRIYEHQADVSPDGKYMIYFATNHKCRSETGGLWTAVSRVPWLKAIALYSMGDTWEGGGVFLSSNRYWLNVRNSISSELRTSSEVQRDKSYIPEAKVYHHRLLRDEWRFVTSEGHSEHSRATIFEKTLPSGWVLKKIGHIQSNSPKGKGCYWEEHELVNSGSKTRILQSDWEWAELDRDTLVWASKGCLYRAVIHNNAEIGDPKMLYDFNPLKFEQIKAPY